MEEDTKIPYFFLGLGVGIAVGVLFAPKAGSETREMIRGKAEEGKDYLRRRGDELRESAEELVDQGRQVVSKQKDQLATAVQAAKQAYREKVTPYPVASDSGDAASEGV